MGEQTNIAWCNSTFNPWVGCTEVGPGCDHCYAAEQDSRKRWDGGKTHWGAGVPRYRTSESNWRQPLAWNRKAAETGKVHRVFCASLADVFDNEVPDDWRDDLFYLISYTPNLQWLLVTKRIGNVPKMMHPSLFKNLPNVRILITVCNQEEADRDIPKLLALPCKNGLSMEPLLSYIDLSPWLIGDRYDETGNCVSGTTGNRRVLGGQNRDDLEASQAHSREPHRNPSLLESNSAETGSAVEVGRLSDGDVFGRRETSQGIRSPRRLDGPQSGGYSAGHGSEPRERQAGRLDSDQPDADDAVAECDPRHPHLGSQAKGSERREESLGTAHGGAGIGHSQVEREDGAIAARGDVRSDAGHDFGRRNSQDLEKRGIGWAIIGGESGSKARPFDLAWARSTVAQCKAAGVPVFVKQIGSAPRGWCAWNKPEYIGSEEAAQLLSDGKDGECVQYEAHEQAGSCESYGRKCMMLKDRAGADPAEWPEDLRVREFPC